MNFDITRAWKDETYRQNLSHDQLNQLPANPAGELTDTELELISGCGGEEIGNLAGLGAASSATSQTFLQDIHWHSVSAAACDTNTFSAAQTLTPSPLLSPVTAVCISHN